MQDMVDAYKWIGEYIEANRKGVIESARIRMVEEIEEYLEAEGIILSNPKITDQQKEWINHKTDKIPYGKLTVMRSENGKVKTSKNISVDKSEIIRALNILKFEKGMDQKFEGFKVGNYFLDRIKHIEGDYIVKAGCHIMLLSNIKQAVGIVAG